MFIGRKEELEELNSMYSTKRCECILIEGRRRVGKSQLIAESTKKFDGLIISYECFKSTYESNLRNIESEIRKLLKMPYLRFDSLYDVIVFLHENAQSRKILFIIDEYPYMREGDATDSEIKNALDSINKLDKPNPLKLIICGSSIDIMRMLDDENRPLHGRFTCKIALQPLNYLDSAAFYPNASLEDKVNYYCVLGGIPFYLLQIDERLSFDDNVVKLFFSNSPLLATEIESRINNEIAKIENAPFVLNIIGDKTLSYTDIKQAYQNARPEKGIDYVLKKLLDIKAIEQVEMRQDNGKKRNYYRIADACMAFHYSFLERQRANRLLFTPIDYYRTFIAEELHGQFIPHRFEGVCAEFIALMNKKGKLKERLLDLFPLLVNDRATKRSYEFDVVGLTSKGLINFECKYRDSEISKSKSDEEARQMVSSNVGFIKTVFISKSRLSDKSVESYSLDDLFSESLL